MKNLLPYIRRSRNIKQVELAEKLNVTPSYLCKIERGVQEPSEQFVEACSRYLGISSRKIFSPVDKESVFPSGGDFVTELWEARIEKGLKQYELAELLGFSPSYVSRIEKGIQKPSIDFKKRCAELLKISVENRYAN